MARITVKERFDLSTGKSRQRFLSEQKIHNISLEGSDLPMNETGNGAPWKNDKRTRKLRKSLRTLFRQPWQRSITISVQVFALLVLSFMIVDETRNYREKPTGTAVDDDMFPVQKIDFPAIAICNMNLLSRRKVFNLAGEIWGLEKIRQMKNLTFDKVQKLLRYMGHLYTFTNWEFEPGDLQLLDQILSKAYGRSYVIPKIMEDIAPPCRKNFDHCSWGGEIRSCEELFIPRWTPDGNCCTFNYVRWTEGFSGEGSSVFSFDIERTKVAGNEYGLRVFLNPHFDDNYYNALPARGFKVLIYTATDYPDGPSGGMKEVLLGPGNEYFLKVRGSSFYSSSDVIQYDKKKRRCLFNTELYDDFDGTYSYSQCLMLCRAHDILKICGCIPFFYPYPKEFESSRDCSVMDLKCLRTHRYKWFSIQPVLDDLKHTWDEEEVHQENLVCNCLPSCETVDYATFQTGSNIQHYDISLVDFVRNYNKGNVTEDTILLNISFGLPTIVRLRQDVLYYWYDLMSAYGGLCSIFLGISILTPIEILYRCCLRIWSKEKKSNKLPKNRTSMELVKSSKFSEQTIYWKEIIQQKR